MAPVPGPALALVPACMLTFLLTFEEIGIHVDEDVLPATGNFFLQRNVPTSLAMHADAFLDTCPNSTCSARGGQEITPEGWRSVGMGVIAEALCRAFLRLNLGIVGACRAAMPMLFAQRRIDAVSVAAAVAVTADMRLLDIDRNPENKPQLQSPRIATSAIPARTASVLSAFHSRRETRITIDHSRTKIVVLASHISERRSLSASEPECSRA